MPVQTRVLKDIDAVIYRELRLRALKEHPEAFATSYEEELLGSITDTAQRLTPGAEHLTLGAFHAERLSGIATLIRPAKAKLRHRATLAAMYVVPEARAQRLGRAMLERVLEEAGAWGVTDVALSVTLGNHAARKLYASAGFISYGIEPRSLYVDGCFYDVELMNLQLKRL